MRINSKLVDSLAKDRKGIKKTKQNANGEYVKYEEKSPDVKMEAAKKPDVKKPSKSEVEALNKVVQKLSGRGE